MFIHRQVLEIEAEITPEYRKALVSQVIEEELSRKGRLNIYVVVNEQDMYAHFTNIYSLEDDEEEEEALLLQAEETVLCFRTKTVYSKVDNNAPTQSQMSRVADVYTHDQLKRMGVSFRDRIPEQMATPYAQIARD